MTILFLNRSRKRIGNAPAMIKTYCDRPPVNSLDLRPLRNTTCFSVPSNVTVSRCVSSLIFLKKPMAILRRIIFIVINTVNRMFRGRRFSHIFKKVLKRVQPSLTYFYTTTAVIFIAMIILVSTAVQNTLPCTIDLGFGSTMSAIYSSNLFLLEAATTECPFGTEIIDPDSFDGSTITLNQAFIIGQKLKNSQSSVFLSYPQIFFLHLDLRFKDNALMEKSQGHPLGGDFQWLPGTLRLR